MGLIVSIAFVTTVLVVVGILEHFKIVTGEYSRKTVHIIVAHWWFIAMYYFTQPIEAAIVPALFIVVNYISFKGHYIKSIERGDEFKHLGTVYYAVSLFVLAIWSFGIERPEIGGMGIMVMGYSDGLAALVGQKYGKHTIGIFGDQKTLEGSVTALIAAFIVILAFNQGYAMGLSLVEVMLLATIATILEGITPLGFDNLTVPIGISVMAYILT